MNNSMSQRTFVTTGSQAAVEGRPPTPGPNAPWRIMDEALGASCSIPSAETLHVGGSQTGLHRNGGQQHVDN